MKQRDQAAMSPRGGGPLLAEGRKLQLATINQDGTPHLVTMFHTMIGGQQHSDRARVYEQPSRCWSAGGLYSKRRATSSYAGFTSVGGDRPSSAAWRIGSR
ncbi:MAG: hypothetical protein QOJ73_5426 [Streptosporangiaceae bacterium]|nr:hypothetical protein [Streptosporangiaceae bacterium]